MKIYGVSQKSVPCVNCNNSRNTCPVGVLHHYMFIVSQLRLTSHLRSTVVLLDTGSSGTSKEIYSEDADHGARTRNPSVINRVL